ncbi:DUF4097 family beta strand repeat-containing protein [Lentzea cavernae]|nr:DUF4097 family beta strand repeat-containing protein [Lentzea cavernae]
MRSESFEVSGPVRASVKVEHGHVFVQHGAGVEQARVTLSPMIAGDEVAADLIARATVEFADGVLLVIVPPTPAGAGGSTVVTSRGGMTVTQNFGHVSVGSNVVGMTIVNGRVVCGGGLNVSGAIVAGGVLGGGGVRVNVLVPEQSSVTARTVSADLDTGSFGEKSLDTVDFHTLSGGLHVGKALTVLASTISGDVVVDAASQVQVTSTSGDVELEVGTRAEVSTVSGDVAVLAVHEGVRVSVATVSGDIRVTPIAPGMSIEVSTSTVNGKVRGPRAVQGR